MATDRGFGVKSAGFLKNYADRYFYPETFAEYSILFKFKEGENFNHRNILDISRIKI